MKTHFFKAYSRLGMINIPNKGTALNIGVENGPDAVLTDSFLKDFKDPVVDEYTFPLPESIDKNQYQTVIASESLKFAKLINERLAEDETQIMVGGDHSTAFSSLLAVVMRENPKNIGYIQFDSHGDVHLFKTSPSGNFHGMWLRPFIADFDSPEIASLIPATLGAEQVMFVGNLELEDEEQNIFESKKIVDLTSMDLEDDMAASLAKVSEFVNKYDHIHISFDIDVFTRDIVSATGTPAENGLQPDEVFPVLEILKGAKNKSIDLIEVNPKKKNSQATIDMAQRVLKALI